MKKTEYSDAFFPKLNINKTIQSQVLGMHTYICYNPMSEKHPSTSCPATKHPKHSKSSFNDIREEPYLGALMEIFM